MYFSTMPKEMLLEEYVSLAQKAFKHKTNSLLFLIQHLVSDDPFLEAKTLYQKFKEEYEKLCDELNILKNVLSEKGVFVEEYSF